MLVPQPFLYWKSASIIYWTPFQNVFDLETGFRNLGMPFSISWRSNQVIQPCSTPQAGDRRRKKSSPTLRFFQDTFANLENVLLFLYFHKICAFLTKPVAPDSSNDLKLVTLQQCLTLFENILKRFKNLVYPYLI